MIASLESKVVETKKNHLSVIKLIETKKKKKMKRIV